MSTVAGAPEVLIPELVSMVPADRFLPAQLFELPIDVVEFALKQYNQINLCPVNHYFAHGTYARELVMPKGALATARRHKLHHLCVVSAGEITVWQEGQPPEVITAPATFVGVPGTRRMGYVHDDVIWTTIFPWAGDTTDVDVLLDRYMDLVPPSMPEDEIREQLERLTQPVRSLLSGGVV